MLRGVDLLGLGSKHWDVTKSINALPVGAAIGCFADTFGNKTVENLRAHIKKQAPLAIRVQLWWSTTHKICPLAHIKKYAPAYEELAKEFPGVAVYLSHSCEHTGTLSEVRERMALLRQVAPHCVPVNCPCTGAVAPDEINETHGDRPLKGRYIASTDGRNTYDFNMVKWLDTHKSAFMVLGWGQLMNLNSGKIKPPPAPPARKEMPSTVYIRSVYEATKWPGKKQKPTSFRGSKIAPPLLYKPMSQDTNDAREEKPMFISKNKADHLDIVTSTGRVIATLGYYGTYTGGLHRYYSGYRGGSGLTCYEIANKIDPMGGSTWAFIKDGNKFYSFSPCFRWGSYRS